MLFSIKEIKLLNKEFRPTVVIYYIVLLLTLVIICGSVVDPHFMVRWLYYLVMNTTNNINTATTVMLFGNFIKLLCIFLLGRYAHHLYRFIHIRIYGKRKKL